MLVEDIVEDMVLIIDQGPEVFALDWDSQYLEVSDHKMEKHFEAPLEVQPGEHNIVVFAKADGKEWPQSSARSVQLPRYSAE